MRRGVPPLRASLSGGGARHGCLNWLSISAERAALKRHRRECAMAMNHSGGHGGHMPATGDRRALVISGWLTGLYFLVEFGIGLWTGSVAVDRKSVGEGKSVSVRVDIGGRGCIKKKNKKKD